MKLKYNKTTVEEIETNIELPVYFYYQDTDTGTEEYIKWDGKRSVILYTDFLEMKIKIVPYFPYCLESAIKRSITTKKIFEKEFKYHTKVLNKEVYEK